MTHTHLLPPITRILARCPASNFADGLTTMQHLGVPDAEKTMQQYENYLQTLRDLGLKVTLVEADDRFPDGHFVEDPVVIFRDVALMCRSGAPQRQGEGASLKPYLADLDIVELEDPDATIDGGDVLICADRILVGISERTNQGGAAELERAFRRVLPDLRVDRVPIEGTLHLKSGLTELSPGVFLHDPKMTIAYDLDWAQVIDLPPGEGAAADALPINDAILVPQGYPTALQLAQQYSDHVVALDMSEFQKMEGGLPCLSLRY